MLTRSAEELAPASLIAAWREQSRSRSWFSAWPPNWDADRLLSFAAVHSAATHIRAVMFDGVCGDGYTRPSKCAAFPRTTQ
jgi:hypothetical protein